jgi:hypothetical protein
VWDVMISIMRAEAIKSDVVDIISDHLGYRSLGAHVIDLGDEKQS